MCPLLCSESRAWSLCFQVEFPEAQGDVPPGGQAAGASGGSGSGAGDVAPAEREIGRLGGDGSSSSKPVMVPFACHVNHSPRPHCVRYGRLTPRTQTLDYPAFRPCSKGQQVYISYGPVPNLKLICFYGFAVPSNPHDLVMLQLEVRSSRLEIALLAEYRRPAPRDPPPPPRCWTVPASVQPPEGPLQQQQAAALELLGLTLEHNLQDGPFSKQVWAVRLWRVCWLPVSC